MAQAITNTIKELNNKLPSKPDNPDILTKKLIKKNKKIVEKLFDDKISMKEKNEIIKSFVEKIVFDKQNRELIFYYYL